MNKAFFNVKNISEEVGEITVYGTICKYPFVEYGETSSLLFSKELQKIKDAKKIDIKINSGGGDVHEALAMYHQLKRLSENKEVTAYIDGLAASAATIVALGAEKVVMGKGCYFMIHNPAAYTGYATSDELEKTKELLDKTKENIMDIYLGKTKLSREELIEKMDDETWFNADEALAAGFVDTIATYETDTQNNISNALIPGIVNKIPSELTQLMNKKINKEAKMTLKELKENHSELYNEVKQELIKTNVVTNAIEQAIADERARIKNLDSLKTYSPKAKEIVDKAKFEEVRDYRDVVVDLYNLNAEKAAGEINGSEKEKQEAGFYNIQSGNLGTPEEQAEEAMINAALEEMGFKKGE